MHVLTLVSEAPPIKSGIARVSEKLTEGLRARGVTMDVLSANEIPRWTFKEFRFSSLALRWPQIQRRLGKYDILHIHGTVPTFSDAALILGRMGTRAARPESGIVYTHHSDIDIAGLEAPVQLYNRLHDSLLRLADHLVASTPSYAMRLEGRAAPGRVSAIGFGVDTPRFHARNDKPRRFTVLFVGQLRPYKGVDVLLNAWQQMENADLHIVGDGHERHRLEALAHRLNLRSVYFHGAVSDEELADYYARAHVLVLPSTTRAEAFGLVLLEGMAAGCVPVASDLPGVRDVVGTTGLTFPVGDSQALAERLQQLRDDAPGRNLLGAVAAARAIATGWDYTIDSYLGVYRQVHLGRQLEVATGNAPPDRDVLNHWLRQVVDVADADRASLMLLLPNKRDLGVVASVGMASDIAAEIRLPVGQRLAGFVAQADRPMLVRRRAMPVHARLYARDPQIGSSLILPISCGGRPIGVLNLARGMDSLAFGAADQEWLHRLARQVAPLLDRQPCGPAPGAAPGTERAPLLPYPGPARLSTPTRPVTAGTRPAYAVAEEEEYLSAPRIA